MIVVLTGNGMYDTIDYTEMYMKAYVEVLQC